MKTHMFGSIEEVEQSLREMGINDEEMKQFREIIKKAQVIMPLYEETIRILVSPACMKPEGLALVADLFHAMAAIVEDLSAKDRILESLQYRSLALMRLWRERKGKEKGQ